MPISRETRTKGSWTPSLSRRGAKDNADTNKPPALPEPGNQTDAKPGGGGQQLREEAVKAAGGAAPNPANA